MSLIIGTAGHIDHGKTALIRALTGQETDRLPEERARGISIDLGFARYVSAGGVSAGVVDVPGHERFIRNMLAGAHGIDLALFVIAADDGVMPQTEEHLDILDLLGVRRGIFVITKSDLVDAARVASVREEVAVLASGTTLVDAPVVAVSSTTGAGVEALRAAIDAELALGGERADASAPFRLPIDRAFVARGHGVVVTGTVVGGAVEAGGMVRILPAGVGARVRGIEVHGTSVPIARPGQRAALNLGGVDRSVVPRGAVVCDQRVSRATLRFDARVTIRRTAPHSLASHARVRLHVGTAEALGRVVLVGPERRLEPGKTGWAQLRLRSPVVALRGDRFILRDETGRWTVGGGEVVLPFAETRRKAETDVPAALADLRGNDVRVATAGLFQLLPDLALDGEAIADQLGVPGPAVSAALAQDPTFVLVGADAGAPTLYTTAARQERLDADLLRLLGAAHAADPLGRGVEMERVRSGFAEEIPSRVFRWCVDRLVAAGALMREESLLRLPSHRVQLAATDASLCDTVDRLVAEGRFSPPDVRQLAAATHAVPHHVAELLALLERRGRVVRIAPDLYYAQPVVEEALRCLHDYCRRQGSITAAGLRDATGSSRKFAIGFLEWCDRRGITLRIGDVRKLRR